MHPLSKPVIDLSGQRFGRLVAVNYIAGDDRRAWACQCDCGVSAEVRGCNLRSGKTTSCGCLKRENLVAGIAVRHGMASTPTYKSWDSMIGRCTNPSDPTFNRYGGAGILVCARWTGFKNFLADMGERPAGTSLDRIDSAGNYEPGNCRWASAKMQANNRRNNRTIQYRGETMTVRQLSDLTGVSYGLLRERVLKGGWDVERAVTTPLRGAA